jgi:hypothetical protein
MAGYLYELGDIVCLRNRTRMMLSLPESYEVTALLPPRDNVVQYKVKSEDERFERVVMEDDIELAHGKPVNNNVPPHLRNA